MTSTSAPLSTSASQAESSHKRRRASRACLACRARKVRCDVVFCGKSCTNCRLDFSECVVQLRRKNRCRTIVVSANDRPLSAKEISESDDEAVLSITESGELTTATLATTQPDENNDITPSFEWNDTLGPLLPDLEEASARPLPAALESSPAETLQFTGPLTDDGIGDLEMLLAGGVGDGEPQHEQDVSQDMVSDALMPYGLLDDSHTADDFPLSASSSDLTYTGSEAWQRMHVSLSPSLFTTTNPISIPLSMPMPVSFGAAAVTHLEESLTQPLTGLQSLLTTRNARQLKASASVPEPASIPTPSSSSTVSFVVFSCFPFLAPNTLWKLDHEDDAALLEQRGCLHVPKKPILDEFIKRYFLHVHPMVPLLNELDFWTMYNAPAPLSAPFCQMSLFVFQAMLFLACPFVPQSTLSKLDFSSVPEARASFYRRAKTLFHLEEGRDDISTAQGAFMLTYHAPNMKDRTNSYWLSNAIYFAKSAGAHRYYDDYSKNNDSRISDEPYSKKDSGNVISFQRRTVLKRLWWCCILRDKIMSLGMRRPMQIGHGEFDMSRTGLNENDTGDEIPGSAVYNPATKRVLSQVFAALCELAGILADILDLCYPASNVAFDRASADQPPDVVVKDYVAKLDAWYEAAASKFKATIELPGNVDESSLLFINAAYIYYYTAKACVYKYLSHFPATPLEATGDNAPWVSPPEKVGESFRGVTKSLAELKDRDLVRYLPNTFVCFAVLPFKWHVAGVRIMGGKASAKEPDLTIYYAVFKGFGELYEMTDSALQSIGTI